MRKIPSALVIKKERKLLTQYYRKTDLRSEPFRAMRNLLRDGMPHHLYRADHLRLTNDTQRTLTPLVNVWSL